VIQTTGPFFVATGGGNGRPVRAAPSAPRVASARMLFREALPAIYQEADLGLRFVGALEEVLDPVVALLDSRAAHFDAALAPRDALELAAAWLGVEAEEGLSDERMRALVDAAPELARRRGTRAGLECALATSFPDLALRVVDHGAVRVGGDALEDAPAAEAGFDVYCDVELEDGELAAIARVIERMKPVHVPYRLRARVADGAD
jgi:phage tail-like protein